MPPAAKMSRSEWGVVLILAAINFTHILDFVIIMPLGNRLMSDMKIGEPQFAHIVSSYGIAAAIAGLAFALFADRFDRKNSLLTAYLGFIIATAFCGLADTYEEMLVARVFSGAFGGLAASSIMAVIGDAFEDGRRGTATGIVMSAFAVASIIGLPIGLWLANVYGRGTPFFAVAACSVPVVVFAWIKLPHYRSHLSAERLHPALSLFRAATNPGHLFSFAMMLTIVFGTFTIIPFIAPYMETNCGRKPEEIPMIYAIAGVCTLLGFNVIGRLTDRLGKRPVFITCALLSMGMTLAVTHLPQVSFGVAAVVTSAFMVTAAGRGVPGQALMLSAAHPAMRGAFTSLNSVVQNAGIGMAPLLAGRFMGRNDEGLITGYDTAGRVAVMIAAFSIVLSFFVKPYKPVHVSVSIDRDTPVPEREVELV
ncbi:MAG: MFS transporter [Gemmataceae bacterium]